jgi:IS30 family transposase
VPRYAWNKASRGVRREYFELIRTGLAGSVAAEMIGVSTSCGSLWFIDAGSVDFIERPISGRYLTQDDRIEIADGLDAREDIKSIAVRIGKSYQSVYREIARNKKPDGRYHPWFAHNQAYVRRRRPKTRVFDTDPQLRAMVAAKLAAHWSPEQISRWLRRRHPRSPAWHVCIETIYDSAYRGLIVAVNMQTLRSARTYRHRRGRGRSKDGALKQSTAMRSIHDRPASIQTREQVGHWESQCSCQAARASGDRGGSWYVVRSRSMAHSVVMRRRARAMSACLWFLPSARLRS